MSFSSIFEIKILSFTRGQPSAFLSFSAFLVAIKIIQSLVTGFN